MYMPWDSLTGWPLDPGSPWFPGSPVPPSVPRLPEGPSCPGNPFSPLKKHINITSQEDTWKSSGDGVEQEGSDFMRSQDGSGRGSHEDRWDTLTPSRCLSHGFALLSAAHQGSLFTVPPQQDISKLHLQTCLPSYFPGQIQRVLTFPRLDQELREDKHHVWVLHYILPRGCGPKSDTEAAQGPFLMRLQRIRGKQPVVSPRPTRGRLWPTQLLWKVCMVQWGRY